MEQLKEYYQNALTFLPQLAIGLTVLVITTLIAVLIRKIIVKRLKSKTKNQLLIRFIGKMVALIINITGILLFLSIVGLGDISSKLLAGAGIMTFVIGFAFKDIGENFLSGILLAFKSPFGVNDLIETEKTIGYVSEVNLRETVIKTLDGKDVFIPNSQLVKTPLINYTVDGYLRYDFVVGVDYNTDVDVAIQLILKTLSDIDEVLKDKPPFVIIDELMPSTINLKTFYWIDTFSSKSKSFHNQIRTEIINRVLKNLVENNIYMPADIIEIKNHHQSVINTINKK